MECDIQNIMTELKTRNWNDRKLFNATTRNKDSQSVNLATQK